jgi:hypothetical protein
MVAYSELPEQPSRREIVSQRSGLGILEESQMVADTLQLNAGVMLAAVPMPAHAFQPGERKGAETLILAILLRSRKTQVCLLSSESPLIWSAS